MDYLCNDMEYHKLLMESLSLWLVVIMLVLANTFIAMCCYWKWKKITKGIKRVKMGSRL